MAVLTDIKTDELFAQLMKIDGKAEIVNGRIVRGESDGFLPALAKVNNPRRKRRGIWKAELCDVSPHAASPLRSFIPAASSGAL